MYIFQLLSCGVPELQILYLNRVLEQGEDIELADVRQFEAFPSLSFQLKNIGDAELILKESDISSSLSHDLILPLHLQQCMLLSEVIQEFFWLLSIFHFQMHL